jgi:glycosyltransferase involved in cell wall biosynthesis
MKKVIVIIPAYNEEGRIKAVIAGLPKTIKYKSKSFKVQVVVIDDGSKDKTFIQAKQSGATVLRHVMNSGAGAATRTGLRYAQLNSKDLAYAITIDADGQHAPAEIEKIVRFAELNDAAMVIGNRLHAGNKKDIPLHRVFGNLSLGVIGKILFGIKTKDTQSGLRLFKAEVIPLVVDYTIDRYGFCTEMLWRANRNGVQIQEMPIGITYSSDTLNKGQNNWGVVELLLDLLWLRISE